MARFRPFRGIRFDPGKVGDFAKVVAPPYDVIGRRARDRLFESGPYNVTRLILHPEGHERAGEQFRRWLAEGVLVREEVPAFYLYRQDFELEGKRSRVGVIGALHLEPFDRGVVRPHEQTFDQHKRDRLELTTEVKANLSPIFGLYSHDSFEPEPDGGWSEPPVIDVEHEGVRNRLWVIRDPNNVERIRQALAGRTVFIADGHHRYETALNYFAALNPGKELPLGDDAPSDDEQPAAHVMAFLGRIEDPGMVVLPTHRIALSLGSADVARYERAITAAFETEFATRSSSGRSGALAWLEQQPRTVNAFVVGLASRREYLLLRRPRPSGGGRAARLDVAVLHRVLLGEMLGQAGGQAQLSYSADTEETFDALEQGKAEAIFVLRATSPEEMADVCLAGELLPQKSTFFYPKLLTGLVFHSLEPAPATGSD